MRHLELSKIKAESRNVVTGDRVGGEEKWEVRVQWVEGFSLGRRKILEMDGGDVCTII